MEHITRLELEIAELRKTLINKESELAQYKKLLNAEPSACLHQVETFRDGPASVIGEQLPKWAIERYSRQILLPEIGAAGQRRLCAARTLLVGAGGLGCPAAAYLAGAGVGTIGLVDYDTVDQTNLHRQLLHAERSQGVDKVDSAAEALLSINSHIKVNRHSLQLTSENAFEIVSQYDVVVDCTDNVPSAYLLNDATYKAKIPLVSGKALKMEGQLTIYNYRAKGNPNEKDPSYCGPCHRCVFPAPPPPAAVGSCSAGGVCGPVCGAIGALQALETIKLLVGTTHSKLLVGRMLVFDGDDLTFRIVKLRNRNPKCIVCSIDTEQTKLIDYEVFCSMKAVEKPSSTSESETRHRLRRAAERDRRMSGQSYYGFRKTSSEDRRWVQDVQRAERTLGPPCGSSYCARAATRHCQEFDEDTRARIFKHFWSLSWTEKKAYVRSMVRVAEPKRRRRTLAAQTSRKVDSRHYSLQKDGSKMAVCRRMFLNTLGIRDTMARYWLTDKRERRTKVAVKALSVDSYIDALSKSPPKCQICCQMSTRMYLNAGDVKNVFQLYNKYVGDMKCANLQPVSRKTFCKVFSGRELSIFKPKNVGDVCDLVAEHNFAASCQSECLTHDLTDTVCHSLW